MSHKNFEWVNTTSEARVPKDAQTRTRIREQAMRQAALTRKRNGNTGKYNLRQYPILEYLHSHRIPSTQDARGSSTTESDVIGKGNFWVEHSLAHTNGKTEAPCPPDCPWPLSIPPSMSRQGYASLTTKYGFDAALNLSSLTSSEIGRATSQQFHQQALHLVQFFDHKQWSYWSFVPSVYGTCPSLDSATEAIVARVRQITAPNRTSEIDAAVINSYGNALKILQEALNCPKRVYEPTVLCATEVLALFELLNPSREEAWSKHVAGAANLIRLRGPTRFTTEFDKALLVAHMGPIVTESILNNTYCFLAEDEWQTLLESTIDHTNAIFERSEPVISLFLIITQLVNLFTDITNFICRDQDPSQPQTNDAEDLATLRTRARTTRTTFLTWRDRNPLIFSPISATSSPSPNSKHNPSTSTPRILLPSQKFHAQAVYCIASIFVNRLLSSVSVVSDKAQLEDQTQEYAMNLLRMFEEAKQIDEKTKLCSMFMVQKLHTARATMDTVEEWRVEGTGMEVAMEKGKMKQAGKGDGDGEGIIGKEVFERWCTLFGRSTR